MKNIQKYLLIVFILCCFLGIGYARISDIPLTIEGTASLNEQNGLVISNVVVSSTNEANTSSQRINTYYQTMLNTRTVLTDNSASSVTYQITLKNQENKQKQFEGVEYDDAFYSNPDITFDVSGIAVGDVLEPNEERTVTLTFYYLDPTAQHENTILESVLNFKFKDYYEQEIVYNGSCVFNGQGNDIVGDCVGEEEHIDYIDTGIQLFNDDNNGRDFEIGFTIGEIDPSRFRSGKNDTLISCMNERTPFPGIVFRIEDSKWYFQAGNGLSNTKLSFAPEDITTFKIIRYNNKIYYSINGGEPVFACNMEGLAATFNTTLTMGTAYDEHGDPWGVRYFIGELEDIYFHWGAEPVVEKDLDYWEAQIEAFMNQTMTTAFIEEDAHTFDGTADSGLHTGVALFSTTNYQKDFWVTFDIDEYNAAGSIKQATLFNAKDEANSAANYPGLMLRKADNTKLDLVFRDGAGHSTSLQLPSSVKRVNLMRKGTELFYQVDTGEIFPLGQDNGIMENWNPANCFDTETTFGSNISSSGTFDRIIKGRLSHMVIRLGN